MGNISLLYDTTVAVDDVVQPLNKDLDIPMDKSAQKSNWDKFAKCTVRNRS